MSKIFISYSRNDEGKALALKVDVEALGHDVWIDHELSGGQVWWEKILATIRETDIFIFVLTQDALNSVACQREYKYATAVDRPVLPILLGEGVSTNLLPPELAKIQFVDFRSQGREAVLSLAKAISAVPDAQSLPNPLPEPPDVPVSYLGELAQRVTTADTLQADEQGALLLEIKASLRDPETANDGYALLRKLEKRRDLLAIIATEIEQILVAAAAASEDQVTEVTQAPVKPRKWLLLINMTVLFLILGFLFLLLLDGTSKYVLTSAGRKLRSLSWEEASLIALMVTIPAFLITIAAYKIRINHCWVSRGMMVLGYLAIGLMAGLSLDNFRATQGGVLMSMYSIWCVGIVMLFIMELMSISRRVRSKKSE